MIDITTIVTLAKQANIPLMPPAESVCTPSSVVYFAELVRLYEQERCAQICDRLETAKDCSAVIRGQT